MAATDRQASDAHTLDRLYEIIESRRSADPSDSHTAKLFKKGTKKIAKKLGEEAVETILEAERGSKQHLIAESADLLYHLLVLWADRGVRPDEVWAALSGRMGVSGVAEKRSRAKDRD
jgi:phosphoribosyl-ATP pyrophosphohydrolase